MKSRRNQRSAPAGDLDASAVKVRKELLATALNPSSDFVVLVDRMSMRYLDANEEWLRMCKLAALAAQKSEAERVSHAKSRFMAAVGHDLRQPMHALALCIDELKSADLPGHAYPLLDHMESALHSTQSLLDSIRF
jgi:signal transduction histidine kinase